MLALITLIIGEYSSDVIIYDYRLSVKNKTTTLTIKTTTTLNSVKTISINFYQKAHFLRQIGIGKTPR